MNHFTCKRLCPIDDDNIKIFHSQTLTNIIIIITLHTFQLHFAKVNKFLLMIKKNTKKKFKHVFKLLNFNNLIFNHQGLLNIIHFKSKQK